MQLLNDLQGMLQRTYALDGEHRVSDFLTTNPALAESLGLAPDSASGQERVLVSQGDESVDLAVYLHAGVLERLGDADPLERLHDGNVADFWTVLEGVSHFVYLAWNAGQSKPVTLLELELQAEVDKFVLTSLLVAGQQGRVPDALHHGLFRLCRVDPSLDPDSRARYEAASRYAGSYCASLLDRFLRDRVDADLPDSALVSELRHFYRLTQRGKLSHIEARRRP